MEFNEVIAERRSIRKYKPDSLPEDTIDELLRAASLAPSGLNLQPWRFVSVQDEKVRRLVGESTPSRFVAEAPVILLCCMDLQAFTKTGARIAELNSMHAISDAAAAMFGSEEFVGSMHVPFVRSQLAMYSAIALTHVMLKAVDLGLGTCWVGYFDEEKVKAAAGIGPEYAVLALLPVGFPAQQPEPRPRLPVSQLLLKII